MGLEVWLTPDPRCWTDEDNSSLLVACNRKEENTASHPRHCKQGESEHVGAVESRLWGNHKASS